MLVIAFTALGLREPLCAAEVELVASVNETNITLTDQVTYILTVKGQSQSMPNPQFPDFAGFKYQILNSRSQSMQIINSDISVTFTYQALLMPTAEGKFTINPASITVNGKTVKSNPITITVSKQPAAQSGAPVEIEGQGVISAKTGKSEIDSQLKDKLFLLPVVSNKKPYIGEPITIDYYIYNQGFALASGPQMDQIPEFNNFIKEITFEPKDWQKSASEKVLNGKRFQVYKILGAVLIAVKSDKLTIDPFRLGLDLQTQGRRRTSIFGNDPFDDFDSFFGGSRISVNLPIMPIEIDVQPLPTDGKPPNFSGTVGSYKLDSQIDQTKITQDQALTLKMTFSGEGDIEAIVEPKLPELKDFTVYDVQKSSKKEPGGSTISGEKKFEFILKPAKYGALLIPEIEYSIFNPKTKKYETLKSKPFTVDVEKGAKIAPPVVVSAPQNFIPGESQPRIETTSAINYIKTKLNIEKTRSAPLFKSPVFIIFQLLPLLIFIASFIYRQQRELVESDVARTRKRKARGEAARRLRQASAHQKENNDRFFAEISKAVYGFLADNFNQPAAGITHEVIRTTLEERNIETALINDALKLLEDADALRYTPAEVSAEEREKFMKRAEDIIDALSKTLK